MALVESHATQTLFLLSAATPTGWPRLLKSIVSNGEVAPAL